MSQSRIRKPLTAAAAGDASPHRVPTTKTHGDSAKPQQPQLSRKNKSRSKIPKSIRHDLENALVGLCDVWFEEIKPHLLRNNIKVHIHNTDGAGVIGAGAGDHNRERLPSGSPGCSHLNPGAASDRLQRQVASCADCSSTRRMASKVQSRKPRLPTFKLLSPINSLPRSLTPEKPYPKKQEIPPPPPPQARTRRRRRRWTVQSPLDAVPFPQSNWRVPRPCRPYSLSPHSTSKRDASPSPCSVRSCSPTVSHCTNEYVRNNKCSQGNIIRKYSRTKNTFPSTKKQSILPTVLTRTRATQTDWTYNNKLQDISPQRSLNKRTISLSNPSKSTSTHRLTTSTFRNKSPDPLKKIVSPKQSRKIRLENELSSATLVQFRSLSRNCQKKTGNKTEKKRSGSSLVRGSYKCSRENFSTSYTLPVVEMSPLFTDDLIEIIGENHDRLVRKLNQPSRRKAAPSTMTLFLLKRKICRVKKQPPWR
ncbi:serine/arginine repetitive matrix protein 1-like [Hyposmocoma kahamanoa]|uniref:serine/arginine repetitive matrix protein 1-like n=1 Tax=Hyposmocoma kahamanoa TaxID=1477025 RepID=UPI000E6D6980|nr:serine/arginine repetitive matrix protein 1-like [Hyposmocoma kahamanoa]